MRLTKSGVAVALLLAEAGVCQNTIHPQSFPPVQTFNPSTQADVDVRLGDVYAKAHVSLDEADVYVQNAGRSFRVILPAEMALVNKMALNANRKLIVQGMVNGSRSEIAIIDVESAKTIDKFLCYLPSISPDGKYIAFAKFYPAHFASQQSDQYMLYDTQTAPASNSPAGSTVRDWISAGKLIYPKQVTDGDVAEASTRSEHMDALAEFFWSQNGREYVFLDKASEAYSFIEVRVLQSGVSEIMIKRLQTNETCPQNVNARGEAVPCKLLLRSIKFGDTGEPLQAQLQVAVSQGVTVNMPQ